MANKDKTKAGTPPAKPSRSKVGEKVKNTAKRIKNTLAPKKPQQPGTVTSNRLHLLVTIVARPKAEYYLDYLESFEINMQLVALGRGTADAKMQQLFGLTDSDKAVIFSVIRENKIADALAGLEDRFARIKNGKGIAYTIPMSSIIGSLLYGFMSNNKEMARSQVGEKK